MAAHRSSLLAFLVAVVLTSANAKKGSTGGSKACAHTGFYSKKVVPLCDKHFPEESSKHVWVVQFYHGRVQKVWAQKDAFEELAKEPKQIDGAKVGAVDCEHNMEFCSKNGIREAPTTRVIMQGNVKEFEGEHTVGALRTFVKETKKRMIEMEESLQCSEKGVFKDAKKDTALPLCHKSIPPVVEQAPWLVAFYETGDHNKDKAMRTTMNKLADKYGNCPPKKECTKKKPLKTRVGAISCGSPDTDCESLGVTKFPTVRFYRKGAEPQDFDSFFDREEIQQWTDARLKEIPKPETVAKALEADMPEGEKPKEEL